MKKFSLILGINFGLAVDCSTYDLWLPRDYPNADTKVAYNKSGTWQGYYNTYYASPTDIPGSKANREGGPWKYIANCNPGTVPQGIDCGNVTDWTPKTYSTPKELVKYEGFKYENQYWATEADVPGESAAWLLVDQCAPSSTTKFSGRARASKAGSESVDCTGVYKWHPDVTYEKNGEQVHFQHSRYSQKWWIEKTPPPQSDAWQLDGPCITGTDTLGYPPGVGLSSAGEKLLCSCCQKCANVAGSEPVCMDEVTDEANCYYAWCPKYNSFEEATCQEIIDEGRLGWYMGDMKEGSAMPDRVFLPYVDVTLANVPNLTEVMQTTGVTHFVLAFVVSDSTKCAGSWGSVFDTGAGPQINGGSVSLYAEINRLREAGGDVVVSFGGAQGTELADNPHCQSGDPIANLKKEYTKVLDLLKLKVLDFDVEGPAIAETNRATGWTYRFAAIKELTQERPDLHLWWTLPVLPTGLVASGLAFVEDLMAAGIRFDRLNLMTMDYGDTACPGDKMHECEIQAVTSVAQQVFDTATKLGVAQSYGFSTVDDVYPHLGSTPMIGMNDVPGETYTLENARQSLAVWHSSKPLGVLSMWSLTRDAPCAFTYVDPTCSGGNVQSEQYEYSKIYAGYPN